MNDIIDTIGLPAVLEQLAEECSELAQASLKYARLLRGENPTPKTEQECLEAVTEEVADVTLCIRLIIEGYVIDPDRVNDIVEEKMQRWHERMEKTEEEPFAQPDTTTHDSIPAETDKNDGDRTSGDCISRQQAIDALKELTANGTNKGMVFGEDAVHRIEMLPSAQPFHNITMTDVLKYIDGMPEDVWQEFTACLECRGWELQRRTAKWCGGDFA